MGAVSIPQAVFACATPNRSERVILKSVSIPQAVFACATIVCRYLYRNRAVSIPQAVFACATENIITETTDDDCFNTASGIRLCNGIPAEAARVLA